MKKKINWNRLENYPANENVMENLSAFPAVGGFD